MARTGGFAGRKPSGSVVAESCGAANPGGGASSKSRGWYNVGLSSAKGSICQALFDSDTMRLPVADLHGIRCAA